MNITFNTTTLVLIAILIVGAVDLFLFSQISHSIRSFNTEILKEADEVGIDKQASGFVKLARYYDEMPPRHARNYTITGDKVWEERYNTIVPDPNEIMKELIIKGDERAAPFFKYQ